MSLERISNIAEPQGLSVQASLGMILSLFEYIQWYVSIGRYMHI